MAEVSINCPTCGAHLKADDEHELAHTFKKHTADVHDMEMPEEEAKKKVKMMLES